MQSKLTVCPENDPRKAETYADFESIRKVLAAVSYTHLTLPTSDLV